MPSEGHCYSQLLRNLTVLLTGLWSRSRRLGLETYQRLVSVSPREKLSTSRSRLGLGHLRLVLKTNFRPKLIVQATFIKRVNYLNGV